MHNKQQTHHMYASCQTIEIKILRNGGRTMINKSRLNNFTITFDKSVDFGKTAKSADFKYNTLPQNQGFEF